MFAVLIGGPNSGKSTLLKLLQKEGYRVMREVAEEVINEGTHQPWLGDEAQLEFQQEVALRQKRYEAALAKGDDLVFLDRGLVDAIAYRLIYGRPLTPFHRALMAKHYGVAFLMHPVESWDDNGVRYEDMEFAREMTRTSGWLYRRMGVEVVDVPFMDTKEERLGAVLAHLGRCPQGAMTDWSTHHRVITERRLAA